MHLQLASGELRLKSFFVQTSFNDSNTAVCGFFKLVAYWLLSTPSVKVVSKLSIHTNTLFTAIN